jgi:hypothetical protein
MPEGRKEIPVANIKFSRISDGTFTSISIETQTTTV